MASTRIQCPSCSTNLMLPANRPLNRKGRCPKCHHVVWDHQAESMTFANLIADGPSKRYLFRRNIAKGLVIGITSMIGLMLLGLAVGLLQRSTEGRAVLEAATPSRGILGPANGILSSGVVREPLKPRNEEEKKYFKPSFIAIELCQGWETDPVGSDAKFTGKLVEVTVYPTRITDDGKGCYLVGFHAVDDSIHFSPNLICRVKKADAAAVGVNLQGQFTFTGKCLGSRPDRSAWRGYRIEIDECKVVAFVEKKD